MVTFLSGGTGTPKLLWGAGEVFPREETTVIANTGDDVDLGGLFVSPDADTVLFERASILDRDTWWGIAADSTVTHEYIGELVDALGLEDGAGYLPHEKQTDGRRISHHRRFAGVPEFMIIGERDRAHHTVRSHLLDTGFTLTETTQKLAAAYDVSLELIPMSDDPVSTIIQTPAGQLHFQEFWVGCQGKPTVQDVAFRGAADASPTTYVLEALADPVVIGPANPVTSLGPMLALPGFREALEETTVVAVSPFVGDTVFSGPAPDLMLGLGLEPSTRGVIDHLPMVDAFVLDEADETDTEIPTVRTDTRMDTRDDAERVARACAEALAEVQ